MKAWQEIYEIKQARVLNRWVRYVLYNKITGKYEGRQYSKKVNAKIGAAHRYRYYIKKMEELLDDN